jgi:hypothetical protein
MSNEELMNQIARLTTIPPESLAQVRSEILRVDVPWMEEYAEYQSGGWWTASLFNDSGDPADVRIRDGRCVPTSLMRGMPATRELVEGLGLRLMWARLARLSTNAFLWEHVDYNELQQVPRDRLHIPLITNSSARFVIAGRSLNLSAGHLWRLAPANPHGVCNYYGPDRIHIVIDCYEDEPMRRLTEQKQLSEDDTLHLPLAEEADLSRASRDAENLLDLGFPRAAEYRLLRLYFEYSMPVGMPYDMIVGLYASRQQAEATLWEERKRVQLGDCR